MRRIALFLMSIVVGVCLALTGCQAVQFAPAAEVGPLVDARGGARSLATVGVTNLDQSVVLASSNQGNWWAGRTDERGLIGTAPSLGEQRGRSRTITTVYDNTYTSGGTVRDRYHERRVTRTETYSDR